MRVLMKIIFLNRVATQFQTYNSRSFPGVLKEVFHQFPGVFDKSNTKPGLTVYDCRVVIPSRKIWGVFIWKKVILYQVENKKESSFIQNV